MRCCLLLLLLNVPVQEVAPIKDRSVDYVSVRNQKRLFGIVLEHGGKNPTVVAVQRAWLKSQQPDQYAVYREQEKTRRLKLDELLASRIDKWIAERPDDADLIEYLKEQRDKLQVLKPDQTEPTSQFILISLEAKAVRRVQRASVKRRAPLWLAYRERLKDIETRSAESLLNELNENDVVIPKNPVDLSDRIPPRGDDTLQWAGRQAIIEQLYRTPVKMAGTPEQIFRDKADGQPADTQALIAGLMQQRMDSVIQDLLSEPSLGGKKKKKPAWFKQAQDEAAKTDSRAVHVTLVTPDVSLTTALVEAYLIGRMPDGKWRVVWKSSHSVKPEAGSDLEAQIREDEQVKSIVSTLGGLGQQDAIDKAIRFAAATMEAQQLVHGDYVKWRDAFFDDLSHPTLRLPK